MEGDHIPGIAETAVIGESVELADDAIVGPGAVLLGPTTVAPGCVVGPGAVLDPGADSLQSGLALEPGVVVGSGVVVSGAVTIGRGAQLAPGTVVTRDVPPYAVVAGNPAQITGYAVVADESATVHTDHRAGARPSVDSTRVLGVTVHHLPRILDLRGNLTVGEFGRTVPFEAKRYFMVFGVPNEEIRGEHAHRTCKQFLVCARGSLAVVADDGERREEFILDDAATGLYLPPLTWGVQYKYSADAVLLVFASEFYDSNEYIRDYAEFRELTAHRRES